MGNREVNYPDISPQGEPPTFVLTLTSTTTPQGMTIINNVRQASSAHLTNIFEMVNHPVINILMVPESKIRNRHYWLIFKLP